MFLLFKKVFIMNLFRFLQLAASHCRSLLVRRLFGGAPVRYAVLKKDSMSTLIKSLILLFIVNSLIVAKNKREFISPDKKTRFIVFNFVDKDIVLESRIRVLNRKGTVLFDTSFASKDHEHGFGVIQAEWTANSKFFVFGMNSSGGHQPWHFFTFAYSVSVNKLISIDKTVEPVTSRFKLFPPDSLEATGFTTNINEEEKFGVRFSSLIQENQ
jgi:hypothetical protein